MADHVRSEHGDLYATDENPFPKLFKVEGLDNKEHDGPEPADVEALLPNLPPPPQRYYDKQRHLQALKLMKELDTKYKIFRCGICVAGKGKRKNKKFAKSQFVYDHVMGNHKDQVEGMEPEEIFDFFQCVVE